MQRRRGPAETRSTRTGVAIQTPLFPEDRKPMLGEIHDVLHEFPELEGKIDEMRANDPAFAKLMDDYDSLDARVRKLEELGTPVADETIEDLKKERLLLKDRLYDLLRH
jgi:uncharacterized protein YdcH (DUF465 family)